MLTTFLDFFRDTTGNLPYAYQCRLACGPGADPEKPDTLSAGCPCASQLIDIPTGLGKTAAVVMAWLWNRVHLRREDWPRRLVICLPMRTLVEQTHAEAAKWLDAHDLRWNGESPHAGKVGLQLLMGGAEAGEWDIHPEADAILIGTQDMLLSRALNRGYGMARARWPMHFGLLNNDSLWVLDETQLMGVGVRTSAQLQGLREKLGIAVTCATWWASATLDSRLLNTPDFRSLPDTIALGQRDLADAEVDRRVSSVKRIAPLGVSLTADSSKALEPYLEALAAVILERHKAGTTTIAILNRVNRARGLFAGLEKLAKKRPLPELVLVHSRFRPLEREKLAAAIKAPGEKIIVATQAIEAGMDISARTLITELAPWSSLVQRFGRCNRKGEFNDAGGADIFWIDLAAEDEGDAAELALPYTPVQLATARDLLEKARSSGASPGALARLNADEPLPEAHIIRRKDLLELFDTTPDLAGLDIDVGRYIRDGKERDVQVFWREIPEGASPEQLEEIIAQRSELVRVAHHEFRKFAERAKGGVWSWNLLDGEWQPARPDRVAPGQVFLVARSLGGYSPTLGWTGEKSKQVFPVLTLAEQVARSARDGQDRDDETRAPAFQSIEEHTQKVLAACNLKLAALPAAESWADALRTAALWHDVGKAHPVFQEFLRVGREIPPEYEGRYLAKSKWLPGARSQRPHFRHELASALAWLVAGREAGALTQNLVAYLIATHHGKIRLSVRAMPGEKLPEPPADGGEPLFARGVWHGERLLDHGDRRLDLAEIPPGPITLDLSCMKLGQINGSPSWTARILTLRDSPDLGVFRLAWLETLLRAADAEGSNTD